MARRWGWGILVSGSIVVSVLVIFINLGVQSHADLGLMTTILYMPCWVVGCWVASRFDRGVEQVSNRTLILSWAGVGIAVYTTKILWMTMKIGLQWTMNLVGYAGAFWMDTQFRLRGKLPGIPLLERVGAFSYSIYLFHCFMYEVVRVMIFPWFKSWLNWPLVLVSAFIGSYVFYILVEKPAHALSRMVANKASDWIKGSGERLAR